MKKKLIALMLAGTLAAAPFALTGCEPNKVGDVVGGEELTASNLVVACTQRNQRVLHRADVYTTIGSGVYRAYYIRERYDFKCDLPDMGGEVVTFPDGVPNEDFGLYDEVCEVCFEHGSK